MPMERSVRHPQVALGRAGAQGPGGVRQDGGPENSESRPPPGCFLFFCHEPFSDPGAVLEAADTGMQANARLLGAGRADLVI